MHVKRCTKLIKHWILQWWQCIFVSWSKREYLYSVTKLILHSFSLSFIKACKRTTLWTKVRMRVSFSIPFKLQTSITESVFFSALNSFLMLNNNIDFINFMQLQKNLLFQKPTSETRKVTQHLWEKGATSCKYPEETAVKLHKSANKSALCFPYK